MRGLVLTAAAAVVVLARCGEQTANQNVNIPGTAPPSNVTITIPRGADPPAVFGRKSVTVALDGTVVWVNSDTRRHAITADDGSFDSGPLDPGEAYSRLFTLPGTFAYHCGVHQDGERGAILVEGDAVPSPAVTPIQTPSPIVLPFPEFVAVSPVMPVP